MHFLEPYETELVSGAEMSAGRRVPDLPARRIAWLIKFHLRELGVTDRGWSVLYRDPTDGRLWEKTYPKSYLQGGGPAVLRVISVEEARSRYGAKAVDEA